MGYNTRIFYSNKKSEKIDNQESQNNNNEIVSSISTNSDSCGTPNCNTTINVSCIIPIPQGFDTVDNPTVSVAVNTECLDCFEEICKTNASITNPCDGSNFSCNVPVKTLRVFGSMTIIASVPATPTTGPTPVSNPHLSCSTTVRIDRVICASCTDTDLCTIYVPDNPEVSFAATKQSDDSNDHVFVQGTITLPSCPEPTPPSF